MERPSCEPCAVPSHRLTRDKSNLLPEVEVLDGVATLTDCGRYQVHVAVILILYDEQHFMEVLYYFWTICLYACMCVAKQYSNPSG